MNHWPRTVGGSSYAESINFTDDGELIKWTRQSTRQRDRSTVPNAWGYLPLHQEVITRDSLAVLFDKDGRLQTTKVDSKNHGIGLLNVKEAVERNNGHMDIQYDEKKFKVTVLLPLQ